MTVKSFQVLSLLLAYPTIEIQAASCEFSDILTGEGLVPTEHLAALDRLIEEYRSRELLDLQERYVLLFDRTRSLSLHLFEHVHGESRDRGQAMVDLKAMYEDRGLEIDSKELPDFIPLFLEFLSTLPKEEAIDLLGQPAHVIAALGERLAKRESSYAAVLLALAAMAEIDAEAIKALLDEPDDDPDDLEALDAVWEAENVTFGPGSTEEGCPKVEGILDRLAAEITSPAKAAGSETVQSGSANNG
ncbi:MAG: nitrate reductase molybdenum cofactor assembly chaperone [Parasphingopyxis sp.]